MRVQLDTSVLVDALTGGRRSLAALEAAVTRGHVLALSALVLYEWRRGSRLPEEIEDQEALLPSSDVHPFGPAEAARAAELYRAVRRPRSRDMDLAIAAGAIEHGASLWTLNPEDFRDIPGLELYRP
jgi:predicted nucleic acid-binding protein